MKKWLILASTVVSTGCSGLEIRQLKSDLCSSLVVRNAPLSEPEVVCQLSGNTAPLRLLPDGVLTAESPSTLRERLLGLEQPMGKRSAANGTTWFRFATATGQLEAGCIPQDTFDDSCVWQLVATEFQEPMILDTRLQQLITTATASAGVDFVLHLIIGARPNGSQEQISIRLKKASICELAWVDPQETKGVKPSWASK